MAKVLYSDETLLKLRLPCLGFETFDRTGQHPLSMMARLFESSRAYGFQKTNFGGPRSKFKNCSRTLLCTNYTISRNWYKKTKDANIMVDVVLYMYLVKIGKSSIHVYHEMHDSETGECYAKLMMIVVYFDIVTRKPIQLADYVVGTELDLRANFERLGATPELIPGWGNITIRAKENIKSQNTHHTKVTIVPSSLDRNKHTNNSHYIRFCLDCAEDAQGMGQLNDFNGDVALYNVERADVFFKKEAVLGDILDVHVWPSSDAKQGLCFVIQKADQTILSCNIYFYPLFVSESKY